MSGNILVIGGTGFIGGHLVRRLATHGYTVRVLSRNRPQHPEASDVSYITGDFLQRADLRVALDNVDIIYHLAATTVPGGSNDQILFDAETNLIGSLQLMHLAAERGVKRLVFVSSGGAVYGVTPPKFSVPEEYPTHPISAHGVSKLAIEKYLEVIRRCYGLEYRIVRAANPYGEGQYPGRGQGFISTAFGCIARDEVVRVWGDGLIVRDFFYVGDLAEALVCMGSDVGPHRIYNVGSGRGYSLNEVMEHLEEVTGRPFKIHYQPGRTADVPYSCLDITRINRFLGWKPTVHLSEGLKLTWSWVRSIGEERMGAS